MLGPGKKPLKPLLRLALHATGLLYRSNPLLDMLASQMEPGTPTQETVDKAGTRPNGVSVEHRSSNRSHVASPLVAEALAVKAALLDAVAHGFFRLNVFSESKSLVNLLNSSSSTIELHSLLFDIRVEKTDRLHQQQSSATTCVVVLSLLGAQRVKLCDFSYEDDDDGALMLSNEESIG
ncbi:hypothetical protein Bca4012_075959 [Brassica carinata]